jgi:predicted glutamine amidotransferase
MCRMIVAVGGFDSSRLASALRLMALNENPAWDHELRSRGANLRHDSGWGAVWRERGDLRRVRSVLPCFDDPGFEEIGRVRTDLMVVHARRTPRPETISIANTHPFLVRRGGRAFAFCHNGEVRDRSQLSWDDGLSPLGDIDSEDLFLHVLTRFDERDPASSLAATLRAIADFTSVNCILVGPRTLVAGARVDAAAGRPRYYTLWHGSGDGLDVVSSEKVEGLEVDWSPIPNGDALALAE